MRQVQYDNAEVWRVLLELEAIQMLPESDQENNCLWVFEDMQHVIELAIGEDWPCVSTGPCTLVTLSAMHLATLISPGARQCSMCAAMWCIKGYLVRVWLAKCTYGMSVVPPCLYKSTRWYEQGGE